MSQVFTDDCFNSSHQALTDLQAFEDNFAALKSAFSGPNTPANTVPGMFWYNTTTHILYIRNEANSAWLAVFDLANNKPVIANLSNEITAAMLSAAIKDAAAGVSSTRKLGSGATDACPGNDPRLGAIAGDRFPALQPGLEISLASAPTERSTASGSFVLVKQCLPVLRPGVVSVQFDMKSSINGYDVWAKIYKGYADLGGVLHNTQSPNYVTQNENITVAIGDVIQIYGYSSAYNVTLYVKNLFIKSMDLYWVGETV
jgi:hypothetical protein